MAQKDDGNGTTLSYVQQSGDPTPTPASVTGGDRYTGLHRFGRVVRTSPGSPAPSPAPPSASCTATTRAATCCPARTSSRRPTASCTTPAATKPGDNATGYDPLGRLTGFSRGTLSASGNNNNSSAPLDTVTGAAAASNWSLDALGNWTSSSAAVAMTAGDTPGTAQNAAATGSYGEQLTTGSSAVTVTSLGRYFVSGNTANHTLSLVDASTLATVASVTVAMSGGSGFVYTPLTTPVTLSASHTYYLVSSETSGGDNWYNASTAVVVTGSPFTVGGYVTNTGSWATGGTAGQSYGLVDLKYVKATGRTTNSQNEVTAAGSAALTYDNNGNTTKDQNGYTYAYDAWNRRVSDTAATETFSFLPGSQQAIKTACSAGTADSFYSTDWQVLEDDTSPSAGPARSTRRRASTPGAWTTSTTWWPATTPARPGRWAGRARGWGRRLYAQQDANWDVTALTNTSGSVVERFAYDPYGAATVLTAAWAPAGTTLGSDTYGWIYGFQGGRYDPQSGLYAFGYREYNPVLGRWMQQDPAGYVDGINRYIALRNDPVGRLDAAGLESHDFIQPEITLNHEHQPLTPIGEITITPTYSDGGADHIKVDLDFRWHPLTNFGEQEATGFDLRREDSGATPPILPAGPPKPKPARRDQASTIGLGSPCMGETIKRVVYVCRA